MPSATGPLFDCLFAARARLDEIDGERRVIESLIRGLLEPPSASAGAEPTQGRRGKAPGRKSGKTHYRNKASR